MLISSTRFRFCSLLLLAYAGLALSPRLHAQGTTLLLWPIQQVIESDRNGSALWIENRGQREAFIQVRVFAWDQSAFRDSYSPQQQVIASPQVAKVPPGQRQLIRLMRLSPIANGQEQAFRVVVDDIPPAQGNASKSDTVGLTFQMRYSLPLFLDGPGIWTKPDPRRSRTTSAATPILDWRIVNEGEQRYLLVRNRGPVHARLSQVRWQVSEGVNKTLAEGLLGYVLPGREMRWPLKELQVDERWPLHAKLADNAAPSTIAHQ